MAELNNHLIDRLIYDWGILGVDWPIFFDSYGVRGYNSPLMSGQQRLPLEVDPFRMAELGRQMGGQIEIGQFKRLLPLLESTTGSVEVELGFDIDEGGIRFLRGKLTTTLALRCQRCLEVMDYPLQSEFRLALVHCDSEAERLPEQYEPLIVETSPIHVLDMIEDEILLSVPHIPMHDEVMCSIKSFSDENELVAQQEEASVKANPFAVLEKLKKDH